MDINKILSLILAFVIIMSATGVVFAEGTADEGGSDSGETPSDSGEAPAPDPTDGQSSDSESTPLHTVQLKPRIATPTM